jgi:hypothetical protein
LCGRLGDQSNHNIVKASLIAVRTGINLTHIYSDAAKREIIIATANVLTPGPASVATQIVLTGTWAAAEALNDVKRLEKGERVPLIKTAEDWVISLENALEEQVLENGLSQKAETGLTYENYLLLFLCFMSRETKANTDHGLDTAKYERKLQCEFLDEPML